jgi:hypothetical protein
MKVGIDITDTFLANNYYIIEPWEFKALLLAGT